MEINWKPFFITVFILLSFTLVQHSTVAQQQPQNEVNKKGNLQRLCGDDFIRVWQKVCRWKKLDRTSSRKPRSITELEKGGVAMAILEPQKANQFLRTVKRVRRSLGNVRDNANEECCYETCSYLEIAEYKC